MRTIEDMVRMEVHHCCSHLVATLAQGAGDRSHGRELSDLLEQAIDLACPIDDWEEAAREAGWVKLKTSGPGVAQFSNSEADTVSSLKTWQELCDEYEINPYQWEVYEHWIVSDWLADQLAALGEKVDKDFAGLAVWARTTTGQAISMDSVIEAVYAVTHKVES